MVDSWPIRWSADTAFAVTVAIDSSALAMFLNQTEERYIRIVPERYFPLSLCGAQKSIPGKCLADPPLAGDDKDTGLLIRQKPFDLFLNEMDRHAGEHGGGFRVRQLSKTMVAMPGWRA
jgi:hypothetical protein